MIGTMYFLRANCAQHGGSASSGGLISASLLKLQGSSSHRHGGNFLHGHRHTDSRHIHSKAGPRYGQLRENRGPITALNPVSVSLP